ncbi:16S rRNA (guanine(527)-N(7))-methyltransferase RsmG [Acidaminobacter sp. JC074]|uniref:16S rRNA (guanine(527)-N(7))-methyltransferase RsmG n=1 Tax=Acidaminobacter sp. JC074 TaxID=2530199 RepID=UPI001F0E70AF|nr:16S rRNA (guanine(527)-N(7))-methyltransferase RsmG [Acidaminobacter sp. JC074]MCH4891237.1 16S rRNA (guanine(527)-N(7))-methyltransferase RsmG [Acidaminobacter sp. JC074]
MKPNLLKSIFSKLGFELSDTQVTQFLTYESLLVEWNKHMNLTGITDSEGIYDKHFADSLTCLLSDKIKDGDKVIDVGTGAGFPGMPLKIFKPSLEITLLDSLNKRINFLKAVADETGLDKIDFIHGRAEDFGQDLAYREQYDIVVSRAVAELPILLEFCSPFLKVGGYFIAQKGKKCEEEIKLAENALKVLNLEVAEIKSVETSVETKDHNLVIIRKVASTDMKYPRRAGKPVKKPL